MASRQGEGVERGEVPDSGCSTAWRIFGAVLLICSASLTLVFVPFDKILKDFILWVQKDVGLWAPAVYALAYIPCTVLAIPASLLTLGGGYLFGLVVGFVTDSLGSTAGAAAAFVVGRTIGRSYVMSKLNEYPQFQAISLGIEKSGFKIVLLLRMVPLLPHNMLNYLLSVTPMSLYTYTLASWLGMMPLTLVFVYVGTTIKDIAEFGRHGGHFTPFRWVLLGAGLFTSAVIVILVTRVAKDALHRAVSEAHAEFDGVVKATTPQAVTNPDLQLHQPLLVRIDTSK